MNVCNNATFDSSYLLTSFLGMAMNTVLMSSKCTSLAQVWKSGDCVKLKDATFGISHLSLSLFGVMLSLTCWL